MDSTRSAAESLPETHSEQRNIAHTMALAVAGLALLIVPSYQFVEWQLDQASAEHLWLHAQWRSLVVVAALATLAWCFTHPDGRGAPVVLRLLSLSIMCMMFGMFASDYLHEADSLGRMVQGLIMTTFAVSLVSLRGGRELLVLFGLPFAGTMIGLYALGASLHDVVVTLFDPLMMAVIALTISEIFYRTRIRILVLDEQLRQLATTDALTGLGNRRQVENQIAVEMARARRHDSTFALILGDLDHFKNVNDRFGHSTGDAVLSEIGRILRSNIRVEDRAVRWGGEEFLILLPATGRDEAMAVAEKIRSIIAESPLHCDGHEVPVTISFGVAAFNGESDVADLIKRADAAMYRAKRKGRNRVCAANGDTNADADRPLIA
ncbi:MULTISPECIES: GGDEF domain-containing protein [unclassified Wenzhouxiangella]|uniref:GGDEF domain-containing protein n=1 Tax=unclassified Wenzhouxiangella TaxID=2613841 RepID=UPI000E32CA41|nr:MULTISPECIES: GGDEF domain-containing protein [unclassified Wenzhouxiangella]RFF27352.1 GGDEF domain-containing protein [Wenzhouxiangella sp. 15181]RFP68782.1 GGDEF domain-containing protein [Wenzhouxiangella sp. 15190]